MLNFAKVLLLVAMATRVSAELSLAEAQKSFDEKLSSQTADLKHEFYLWTSTAKKSISRASAKIEELNNKEFPTDEDGIGMKEEVIASYDEHRSKYKKALTNMTNINKEALLRLKNYASEAKDCVSPNRNDAEAAWCIGEVEKKLVETVQQTVWDFEELVYQNEQGFESCERFLHFAESRQLI